jgi:hypothetical protein
MKSPAYIGIVLIRSITMKHWQYGGHSVHNTVEGLTILLLLMLGRNAFSLRGVLIPDRATDYVSMLKQIR